MIQLNGQKVRLKQAMDTDEVDQLYYWKYEEKEQEAKKWNGPYIPEPFMTKKEFRESWLKENELFPHVPFSLLIIIDGKVTGYVSSYWVDRMTNWLETGIVIFDCDYWNGGYGSEAYKLWIDFLFSQTNLHRLGMSTWSGNTRMMKVAEKIGMREEARIRKARIVNDIYYDAIKMGMLREDWDSSNKILKLVEINATLKDQVIDFFTLRWGGSEMVLSSGIYDCSTLDGFLTQNDQNEIIGLITYKIKGIECEIISLDSVVEGKGTGSRLVKEVEKKAKQHKCKQVSVITTNDNLQALAFYQKRGFTIATILNQAVEKARKRKPSIPINGYNGIPIKDEIKLVKEIGLS
ncbi:GNAT family N-acetyltransferase [Metabacillus sp. HB246100]